MQPLNTPQILFRVDTLYNRLPQVHCLGCGKCCVSPTCTLAEWVYLVTTTREILTKEQFESAVLAPPRLSRRNDGNVECVFLHEARCSIHGARAGGCRLFGIPSLAQLDVTDLEMCPNQLQIHGESDRDFIVGWLNELINLNRELYPLDEQPFALTGLNLPAWFDLYFDTTLEIPYFAAVRNLMHAHVDLRSLVGSYRPATGLRDKIDKINVFFDLIDLGDAAMLRPLLLSILNDYPLSGTWFRQEATAYLAALETGLSGQT